MTVTTTYTCDRCNAPSREETVHIGYRHECSFDLCRDCLKDLYKFMKGK